MVYKSPWAHCSFFSVRMRLHQGGWPYPWPNSLLNSQVKLPVEGTIFILVLYYIGYHMELARNSRFWGEFICNKIFTFFWVIE